VVIINPSPESDSVTGVILAAPSAQIVRGIASVEKAFGEGERANSVVYEVTMILKEREILGVCP